MGTEVDLLAHEEISKRKTLAFRLFMGIIIVASAVFSVFGRQMDENQLFGCLIFWAFFTIWASFLFWVGTWPLVRHLAVDPQAKRQFAVGVAGLLFAIFQIPLWALMTGRFPPDKFTGFQAHLATCGIVISLFAPAAPVVIKVINEIWMFNQEQRHKLREKKQRIKQGH
ncbi:MAG: hypothetical protein GX811_00065 [Lentisphaerae bacterium]|nr:hypothetical protein [Lentisphaerota bacterium]